MIKLGVLFVKTIRPKMQLYFNSGTCYINNDNF